ncbi:MAG: hypothetical protein H6Q72_3913 [Firmicutes bacterium]|nr:hypothetical protein [Bacillota bacterium]
MAASYRFDLLKIAFKAFTSNNVLQKEYSLLLFQNHYIPLTDFCKYCNYRMQQNCLKYMILLTIFIDNFLYIRNNIFVKITQYMNLKA